MNDTTTTAAPATTTVADAVTGRAKTKQNPIVVFPDDKAFLQDIKEEFDLKNDMEAFRVLLTVATDYRFDADGNDRFEAQAKAIHESRDKRKTESKMERLERQLAELRALQSKTADAETEA